MNLTSVEQYGFAVVGRAPQQEAHDPRERLEKLLNNLSKEINAGFVEETKTVIDFDALGDDHPRDGQDKRWRLDLSGNKASIYLIIIVKRDRNSDGDIRKGVRPFPFRVSVGLRLYNVNGGNTPNDLHISVKSVEGCRSVVNKIELQIERIKRFINRRLREAAATPEFTLESLTAEAETKMLNPPRGTTIFMCVEADKVDRALVHFAKLQCAQLGKAMVLWRKEALECQSTSEDLVRVINEVASVREEWRRS